MDHDSRLLSTIARVCVRRAWWVVGFWAVLLVVLTASLPRLEAVIAADDTPVIPTDAAAIRALDAMDQDFSTGDSNSFVVIVIERDGGLTPADLRYYRALPDRLSQDDDVSWVQDVTSRPELRTAFLSQDGEAAYLTVGLPGQTGAPASLSEVASVRDIVDQARPDGLRTAVTGSAGTIADLATETEHSVVRITVVTVVVIGLLLLLLYRSFALTAVVLGMVGLALGLARAVVAGAGAHDLVPVSTFTGSFMTAVVLGASTDYAIFLISRYHELRRTGLPAPEAAALAGGKVSGVVVGSALTVVVANAAMALAHVGIFTTTGPAVALATSLTLAVAITLVPAVLAICGRRGLLEPRPERSAQRWERTAALVTTRPARVLALGLVPLLLLASLAPFLHRDFDTRETQPAATESNRGYRMLDAHYPVNQTLADWVLVHSDHDLRNPDDLAALDELTAAISRVDGVASARSITRPRGELITRATIGYQTGVIGEQLGQAAERVRRGGQDTARLTDGSARLDDGAGRLAAGASTAAGAAGRLVDGVTSLADGLHRLAGGTGQATAGSARLQQGAAALATGLDTAADQTQVAVDGLGTALRALESSAGCTLAPVCNRARDGVRQVYEGERDQLVPGLRQAARAAHRIAEGTLDLHRGLARIDAGLARAHTGASRLEQGQRRFAGSLGQLADGAGQVADGTGRLARGTGQVVGQVDELGHGLTRAASYLERTSTVDDTAFYLPPKALNGQRFALARLAYLSADGHTARIEVLGSTDALGPAARHRVDVLERTARSEIEGTALAGSDVRVAGMAAVNADLASMSAHDFWLLAVVALLAVFLILLGLLRSLVAATLLLISVIVSYASAVGLGVLVWQVLLDEPLDWSVTAIAFTLLVAVGSDYNMLLIKRMQEEAPDGDREGIGRATAATGRVITAAGLIFAASMFALMAGSVTTLVQCGFTIGCGLLLDTFVVRTLVIPALATMLGRRLWWPGNPGGRLAAQSPVNR